jgi:hypothetical protein
MFFGRINRKACFMNFGMKDGDEEVVSGYLPTVFMSYVHMCAVEYVTLLPITDWKFIYG